MTDSASGRPPQLDDREWLARRYSEVGDLAIAQELGCDKRTVRAARQRLGITSAAVGRRRGRSLAVVAPSHREPTGEMVLTGTALAFVTRFNEDQRLYGGAAPSKGLFVERLRAWNEAELNGDALAVEDALAAAGSALMLIHQHKQRLRRAA